MEQFWRQIRKRYEEADKKGRQAILDELTQSMGYHRKSACRLLNQREGVEERSSTGRRGAPKRYKDDELMPALKQIWVLSEYPCGKRLQPILALWLPFYEKHYGELSSEARSRLMMISASSIDRLLKVHRNPQKKGLGGTKPGGLLKHQIPVKTHQWETSEPGYAEGDTVAHCGGQMAGQFIWSLTVTDIALGWTENRAAWNKEKHHIRAKIREIELSLPFTLLGFDADNGSEFINYCLYDYFQERPEGKRVEFTRSRPYHKDDNAHVEQKNYTHVRRVFGYERLDDPRLIPLMNDLYKNELSILRNFFSPTLKLLSKERVGAKIVKKFDKAKTPYERVMESPRVSEEAKEALQARFKTYDPIALTKQLQDKLKHFFRQVDAIKQQRLVREPELVD